MKGDDSKALDDMLNHPSPEKFGFMSPEKLALKKTNEDYSPESISKIIMEPVADIESLSPDIDE